MFRPTSPQTSLFEAQFLIPKDKAARLAKSWAEPFRTRVLPLIDEEVFRDAFAADSGRPNTSIRLLVGLHLLRDWHDLTDAEVAEQLEYNLQWQYALGIEPAAAHVSEKTLWTFRERLKANGR
ncbi:MAG: transposase, partial [Phycisphaerae bacterium]|nr:transposase [Phycisphaerae bacterium]